MADRQAEYTQEMRRIVEATYELIERTGSLDPSLRDILAQPVSPPRPSTGCSGPRTS